MKLDNLIFLDTETTGVAEEDRLCQVAYKFKGKEYNELFKPELPIKSEAMAVCHITNEMLEGKPAFNTSSMKKDLDGILKDNVLVAHNAKFDIGMLEKEGLSTPYFIDTLKVVQYYDTNGYFAKYNMQYLRYEMKLDVEDATAHDALGDIRVLEKLFLRLYEKRVKEGESEENILKEMIEISKNPILIKKISFGKYAGEKVEDVLKNDKGYLEWLYKQKEKQLAEGEITEDDDWVFTLKRYLK